MPTNRSRTKRGRKPLPEISENVRRYLETGDLDAFYKGGWEAFTMTDADIRKAWFENRKTILSEWSGPGQPWAARFEKKT